LGIGGNPCRSGKSRASSERSIIGGAIRAAILAVSRIGFYRTVSIYDADTVGTRIADEQPAVAVNRQAIDRLEFRGSGWAAIARIAS
jgi:hypothetical protein